VNQQATKRATFENKILLTRPLDGDTNVQDTQKRKYYHLFRSACSSD